MAAAERRVRTVDNTSRTMELRLHARPPVGLPICLRRTAHTRSRMS